MAVKIVVSDHFNGDVPRAEITVGEGLVGRRSAWAILHYTVQRQDAQVWCYERIGLFHIKGNGRILTQLCAAPHRKPTTTTTSITGSAIAKQDRSIFDGRLPIICDLMHCRDDFV